MPVLRKADANFITTNAEEFSLAQADFFPYLGFFPLVSFDYILSIVTGASVDELASKHDFSLDSWAWGENE